MRISPIKTSFRNFILATSFILAPSVGVLAQQNSVTKDTFEKTLPDIKPEGSRDSLNLAGAPSPNIEINGIKTTAAIVVDLSKNTLYKYDKDGNAECAYLVASGKASTPTHTGIRQVTHIETFPYKTAPLGSKRRQNPRDYGPKIICLEKVDPESGDSSITGEFIHGNNNSSSIGKYTSKGCIRMDNEVIKLLASDVQRGDIVVIGKF